ncbi:MAG: hypothetical protein ACRDBQ_18785 [Shewanella sp.]
MKAYIDGLNSVRGQSVDIMMAVLDDLPQGIIVFEPGQILHLYVNIESRRCGVGSYLLKCAKERYPGKLIAAVPHAAVGAVCFFHKKGFGVEAWRTVEDGRRMLRLVSNVSPLVSYPEVDALAEYSENVPIFINSAGVCE